jgi:flavin-binding protein dodecin
MLVVVTIFFTHFLKLEYEETTMSVSRTTEIKATSTESFDDAIKQGVRRAAKTLRNVKAAWVENQDVRVDEDGEISEYRVQLKVTFILED